MAEHTIKICAFGDSVMWGQGLQKKYKFIELFRQAVSQHFKRPVVIANLNTDSSPHSGATTTRMVDHANDPIYDSKEIPTSAPSVQEQIQLYQPQDATAADVGYVLLNGGANDISLDKFTHLPWGYKMSKKDIERDTKKFCFDNMSALLEQTLSKFPNATVAVVGYYPVISSETFITADNLMHMIRLRFVYAMSEMVDFLHDLATFDWEGLPENYLDELRETSKNFAQAANRNLQNAVDTIRKKFPGRKVHFVDPKFGPENAIFAKNPFVWSLDQYTGVTDFKSEDSPKAGGVRDERSAAVDAEVDCSWFNINCRFRKDYIYKLAAIGHPNVRGAQRYADQICDALGIPKVTPVTNMRITRTLSSLSVAPTHSRL